MDDFVFVPLRSDDLGLLATWLARPHVARWWREPADPAAVTQTYAPLVEGLDPTEAFIVHLATRPIGYVQRYVIGEDPDWRDTIRAALPDAEGIGIDYLIGEPELVGRGLGRRMIARFVETCWERYRLDEIVVALQQENVASRKALEACGFRRVWSGILVSSDPSDRGPSHLYVARRPTR